MIDGLKILNAIDELVKEKNLDRELIINSIKEGIIKAYEKHIDSEAKIKVLFDEQNGNLKVYRLWYIVEEINNSAFEINEQQVKKEIQELQNELEQTQLQKNLNRIKEIEDSLLSKLEKRLIEVIEKTKDNLLLKENENIYQEEIDIENFSRLAATQVGQIFVQSLKEAEREIFYEKYISKKGEILIGEVYDIESGRFTLKISENTFAVLLKKNAIPFERLNSGDKIKFYVEDVKKNTGQIVASRIHSAFLQKLLEIEVPEIYEHVIEIKAISRIPGERAKVAVFCNDATIDPIGACVGTRGQRIQNIMKELNGEKIDIIKWDENIQTFIINAVSPAKVISIILNFEINEASIIVPDEHYSLSIGKKGITAKLTARITEWKINIIPYSKAQEEKLKFEWNGNLTLETLKKLQEEHKSRKEHKSEIFSTSQQETLITESINNTKEEKEEIQINNDESFYDDLDDTDDFEEDDFEEDDFKKEDY